MPSKLPLLVLLLFASLLLAGTARAVPASSAAVPFALEEELDFEVEEEAEIEEASACEAAEAEFSEGQLGLEEAGEICEEEAEESGQKKAGRLALAPEECILRSAHAHAAVNDKSNKLKLTLGYTTSEPIQATIQLRSGSTRVGTFKRRLGKSGVLRFTRAVTEQQSHKRVFVDIELPSGEKAECPSRRLALFPR